MSNETKFPPLVAVQHPNPYLGFEIYEEGDQHIEDAPTIAQFVCDEFAALFCAAPDLLEAITEMRRLDNDSRRFDLSYEKREIHQAWQQECIAANKAADAAINKSTPSEEVPNV